MQRSRPQRERLALGSDPHVEREAELLQWLDAPTDVVIPRALLELFGKLVVVFESNLGDFSQVLRRNFHSRVHTKATVLAPAFSNIFLSSPR